MVIIQFNNSNLWKRWIFKLYLDWELERTHPYERLSNEDSFCKIDIKWEYQQKSGKSESS